MSSISMIKLRLRNGHSMNTHNYKIYCLHKQALIWLSMVQTKHNHSHKIMKQTRKLIERDLWTLQEFQEEMPQMYEKCHKGAFREAKKMYQERKPAKVSKIKEPAF